MRGIYISIYTISILNIRRVSKHELFIATRNWCVLTVCYLFFFDDILSGSVVCFCSVNQVRVCGKCLYKRGLFTARIITY